MTTPQPTAQTAPTNLFRKPEWAKTDAERAADKEVVRLRVELDELLSRLPRSA